MRALISITVIIPTFDRVTQTIAAVESALGQSRVPDRVIVIDDGSSHDVKVSLASAIGHLAVDVIWAEHSGHPGRVRNLGLAEVTTSHVAMLDSDDLWAPDKLLIQEKLALLGVRAQGSGYISDVDFSGWAGACVSASRLHLRTLLKGNVLCNSSVLIETSLLRCVGGVASSYAARGIEDYATWLRVGTYADWYITDTPLVLYSDSPATSMRGTNEFLVDERTLALWEFARWLGGRGFKVPIPISAMMRGSDALLRLWASKSGALSANDTCGSDVIHVDRA